MSFLPIHDVEASKGLAIAGDTAAGLFALTQQGGRALGYVHTALSMQVPDSSTNVGGLSWFSAMNEIWRDLIANLERAASSRYPTATIITGVTVTLDPISDTVGTWSAQGTACYLPILDPDSDKPIRNLPLLMSHHHIQRTLSAIDNGFVPLALFAVASETNERYSPTWWNSGSYSRPEHELTRSRLKTINHLTNLLHAEAERKRPRHTPIHIHRGRTIITSFRSAPEEDGNTNPLIMDMMCSASGQSYLDLGRPRCGRHREPQHPRLEIRLNNKRSGRELPPDFRQFPVLGTATYRQYELPELVSSDLHDHRHGEECPEHPRELVIEAAEDAETEARGDKIASEESGPSGPGFFMRAITALAQAWKNGDEGP